MIKIDKKVINDYLSNPEHEYDKDYSDFKKELNSFDKEESVEETKPIAEPVHGVVIDCAKLNVRELPNPNAPVVTIIKVSSKVLVDETESTEDFYKVYTETGVDGYCMKKFIAV